MTTRFRRALAATSVALALVAGLAGCTGEPEIAERQADAYRAQVVAIAEASAAGDYAGAVAALDALQAEVDAGVTDGTIADDREQRIAEAIALVRADLEAAIAAATTPEPAPAEPLDGQDGGDTGGGDTGTGDSSGPGNSGENANTGKGEEKGKGKGKD